MNKKNLVIATLLCTSPVQAGRFKDFCARHIIADDPNQADELIEELRALYPNPNDFQQSLRDIYFTEINKINPDKRLLMLAREELGL